MNEPTISSIFRGETCHHCQQPIHGDGIVTNAPELAGDGPALFHPACYEEAWRGVVEVPQQRVAEVLEALSRDTVVKEATKRIEALETALELHTGDVRDHYFSDDSPPLCRFCGSELPAHADTCRTMIARRALERTNDAE